VDDPPPPWPSISSHWDHNGDQQRYASLDVLAGLANVSALNHQPGPHSTRPAALFDGKDAVSGRFYSPF